MMPLWQQSKAHEKREKQILAGLFLSRFDKAGLTALGFSSFSEAFNAIGYALGAQPASIKNYRDEFDPIYSENRKGWHKRLIRSYCRSVSEKHEHLSLEQFAALLKMLIYGRGDLDLFAEQIERESDSTSSFAKRLVTGQAAERYFEAVQAELPVLADYAIQNVTQAGCGFDYKLTRGHDDDFLAVEVKGLGENFGVVTLTEKEHRVAGFLADRFFLFVARNFRERPTYNLFRDPLCGGLSFTRRETRVSADSNTIEHRNEYWSRSLSTNDPACGRSGCRILNEIP
jgi:hypothetical protein